VQLTTAQRAFCLLFKAAAQVVSMKDGRLGLYNFESWREISEMRREFGQVEEHDEFVQTVSYDIQVPRIVRLLVYNDYPEQNVSLNRRNLFARDGHRCQYCGERFPTSELSLDHVRPLSQGGKSTWLNLVCACTECNKVKGGRTPRQANMHLIRKPAVPKFDPTIRMKLRRKKYNSWKQFLDEAYWSVPLE
jgi:5-methylcytosine-specific restriction endonuclease McrA